MLLNRTFIFVAFTALSFIFPWGSSAATPVMDKSDPVIVIKTKLGDIKVELYEKKAPITVKNFLAHIEKKDFNPSFRT